MNIDGTQRVKNDLEIVCYQGSHLLYSLAIALPSIIVWGLGIPLFAYVLMYRERNRLESVIAR